jgi:hypothetical protein
MTQRDGSQNRHCAPSRVHPSAAGIPAAAVALFICAFGLLVPGESGRSATVSPPGASVLLPSFRSSIQQSIEIGRLDGTARKPLTRKVARYEIRNDGAAVFSPDGTKIAFERESKRDPSSVMIVNRDGTGMRRVLTLAQAKRIAPRARGLGDATFTPDGASVVIALHRDCVTTEALVMVALDGTAPTLLWRRPRGAHVSVLPRTVLPDGQVLVSANENTGDCIYFSYEGRERLLLLRPGDAPRRLGPASSLIGEVLVTPDGRSVVWAADCFGRCQIWAANLESGAARQLSRFRTRSFPLGGFDSITLALPGDSSVVYGRGRSLYRASLSGTPAPTRIASFVCPRKSGCHYSEIDWLESSPDGAWVFADVTDHGCELCEAGADRPIRERFAVRLSGGQPVKLPVLQVFDLRFD